jgi:hypothetical protein
MFMLLLLFDAVAESLKINYVWRLDYPDQMAGAVWKSWGEWARCVAYFLKVEQS